MSKETKESSKERKQVEKEQKTEELLEQERRRSEELLSKMKYLQADFENYRKRMEKEIQDVEEHSLRGLVTRLLTVLDELELAVANAERSDQKPAVSEGIRMVYGNLSSVMKSAGLKKIEAVGMPFDPKLHEAVEKAQGSPERDVVVEEIRSGYTFRSEVLRPSMVKVELAPKKAGGQEARANE
jgi:molecular chaperone GrpE